MGGHANGKVQLSHVQASCVPSKCSGLHITCNSLPKMCLAQSIWFETIFTLYMYTVGHVLPNMDPTTSQPTPSTGIMPRCGGKCRRLTAACDHNKGAHRCRRLRIRDLSDAPDGVQLPVPVCTFFVVDCSGKAPPLPATPWHGTVRRVPADWSGEDQRPDASMCNLPPFSTLPGGNANTTQRWTSTIPGN